MYDNDNNINDKNNVNDNENDNNVWDSEILNNTINMLDKTNLIN